MWVDVDEAQATEPTTESFAYLPWWFATSWGNRGMENFWGLQPPAQARTCSARDASTRCALLDRVGCACLRLCRIWWIWGAPRPSSGAGYAPAAVFACWWAYAGCAQRRPLIIHNSFTHCCSSTAGTTGRRTTRLPAPRTQTPSSCCPPRRRACWPWRPGWGGTPRPRRSFGAWRCRCGGGGVRGGGACWCRGREAGKRAACLSDKRSRLLLIPDAQAGGHAGAQAGAARPAMHQPLDPKGRQLTAC